MEAGSEIDYFLIDVGVLFDWFWRTTFGLLMLLVPFNSLFMFVDV